MRLLLLGIISLTALVAGCVSTGPTLGSTKNTINPKAASYNIQLGVGYLRQGNYERAK